MAATTETVKTATAQKFYEVLSPVKVGGKRYASGEAVALEADEAKRLAGEQIVSAKAIKPPKADPDAPKDDEGKPEGAE